MSDWKQCDNCETQFHSDEYGYTGDTAAKFDDGSYCCPECSCTDLHDVGCIECGVNLITIDDYCASCSFLIQANELTDESELGIPEWVARLNDMLHENTSDDVWPTLQLRFLKSVRTGFESWDSAEKKIKLFIQRRNVTRVEALALNDELKAKVLSAINHVIYLIEQEAVTGEDWSAAELAAWSAAALAGSAAGSAARSAAWSAAALAGSAAGSAARSAAWSAAWSAAESAAESAESAAWSAAESAGYDAIAEELIRIMEAA